MKLLLVKYVKYIIKLAYNMTTLTYNNSSGQPTITVDGVATPMGMAPKRNI